MLKGLDPVLSPALRAMGHGDEIALVDGNYPGDEHGRRLVRADGLTVARVLDAVLSVLPVEEAIFRAVAPDRPDMPDPVHRQMIDICRR